MTDRAPSPRQTCPFRTPPAPSGSSHGFCRLFRSRFPAMPAASHERAGGGGSCGTRQRNRALPGAQSIPFVAGGDPRRAAIPGQEPGGLRGHRGGEPHLRPADPRRRCARTGAAEPFRAGRAGRRPPAHRPGGDCGADGLLARRPRARDAQPDGGKWSDAVGAAHGRMHNGDFQPRLRREGWPW